MRFDRPLIFDACALINLHASGRLGDVLRSVPHPTLVRETVRTLELRQTETLDALNPVGDRLGDLIASGQLTVVDFADDTEAGRFIDFAFAIGDDGEAASLAIAVSRGFCVVTDDRRARQFAAQEVPSVSLVYTLEVLAHWTNADAVPPEHVRSALTSMRHDGRYVPPRSHPQYDWWSSIML